MNIANQPPVRRNSAGPSSRWPVVLSFLGIAVSTAGLAISSAHGATNAYGSTAGDWQIEELPYDPRLRVAHTYGLAIDSAHQPVVCYGPYGDGDAVGGCLHRSSNGWESIADTVPNTFPQFVQLLVDRLGRPQLVFAVNVQSERDGIQPEVHWASWTGTKWDDRAVEKVARAPGRAVIGAAREDDQGVRVIAYSLGSQLKAARFLDPNWIIDSADERDPIGPPGLTMSDSNHFHFAYQWKNQIKYAGFSDGKWMSEKTGASSNQMSQQSTPWIAVQENGNLHILMQTGSREAFYIHGVPGTWSFEKLPKECAGINAATQIHGALDSDGLPLVVGDDIDGDELYVCRRTSMGWQRSTLLAVRKPVLLHFALDHDASIHLVYVPDGSNATARTYYATNRQPVVAPVPTTTVSATSTSIVTIQPPTLTASPNATYTSTETPESYTETPKAPASPTADRPTKTAGRFTINLPVAWKAQ